MSETAKKKLSLVETIRKGWKPYLQLAAYLRHLGRSRGSEGAFGVSYNANFDMCSATTACWMLTSAGIRSPPWESLPILASMSTGLSEA